MTLSAPAFAGPALDSLTSSAGGAEELLAPAPVRAAANYKPTRLNWGYTLEELRSQGTYGFAWGEDNYVLRPIFGRGSYDPYVKNFKAQPQLMLETVEGRSWPRIPVEATLDHFSVVGEGPHDRINLAREKNTIYIYGLDEEGNYTSLDSVEIKYLYSNWAGLNKQDRVAVFDKSFFMVPQASMDEDLWGYGYVLSEKFPVQPATGLPQDYVELFRENADGFMDFKPKAYSLALGLVFELQEVNDGAGAWDVRPMLEAEMQEAINDSLGARTGFLPAAAALKAVK